MNGTPCWQVDIMDGSERPIILTLLPAAASARIAGSSKISRCEPELSLSSRQFGSTPAVTVPVIVSPPAAGRPEPGSPTGAVVLAVGRGMSTTAEAEGDT